MANFKKGDIVSRTSYRNDVLFMIEKIIEYSESKKVAILKGITIRIEADSLIDDLKLATKEEIKRNITSLESRIESRLKDSIKLDRKSIKYGTILHLDGDRTYSEKSIKYYKKLGLSAIVKNVKESRQSLVLKKLLDRYSPDILVITGHDGMIKNGTGYTDIYNYRNSYHFIKTVMEARKLTKGGKDLVIFAGACQSYYEALIQAGANFASSPARILIDFIDPLIVAEKVATTDSRFFLSIRDIEKDLRDGQKGVSGIGAKGKKNIL